LLYSVFLCHAGSKRGGGVAQWLSNTLEAAIFRHFDIIKKSEKMFLQAVFRNYILTVFTWRFLCEYEQEIRLSCLLLIDEVYDIQISA